VNRKPSKSLAKTPQGPIRASRCGTRSTALFASVNREVRATISSRSPLAKSMTSTLDAAVLKTLEGSLIWKTMWSTVRAVPKIKLLIRKNIENPRTPNRPRFSTAISRFSLKASRVRGRNSFRMACNASRARLGSPNANSKAMTISSANGIQKSRMVNASPDAKRGPSSSKNLTNVLARTRQKV